jgi:hypothetical protein
MDHDLHAVGSTVALLGMDALIVLLLALRDFGPCPALVEAASGIRPQKPSPDVSIRSRLLHRPTLG